MSVRGRAGGGFDVRSDIGSGSCHREGRLRGGLSVFSLGLAAEKCFVVF